MLDDWIRRANRPPRSSSAGTRLSDPGSSTAAEVDSSPSRQRSGRISRISQADDLDEEYDIVSRQAKALENLYR